MINCNEFNSKLRIINDINKFESLLTQNTYLKNLIMNFLAIYQTL